MVELGLAQSRERARALIIEGVVLLDGVRVMKPSDTIRDGQILSLKENPIPFVSRGGLKLQKAIDTYQISLKDRVCVDIGASTGGFTDCMLMHGAKKVFAVDVGYGQLDWKLRNDERVVCMERHNARFMNLDWFDEQPSFASIDVSFISIGLIIPRLNECLSTGGAAAVLVKPQFEAGRDKIGKNGVVKNLRMENTGKVTGVFDLNFDKREFSAVHTIEGWKTWAMQDVSTAVYRAAKKQLVSGDVMLQKLLECLNGKEITSAGHLSARNFSFGEEIIESDGKLNFYLQADFDVDAAFGTFVCTDQNDDWLNIYANYDIEKGRPCDTLELNLCKGDGTEENWSYHLNAAEQEVLARKMEAFCQQQTGMSLHEYARQLQEEPGPTPQIQI